MNAKKTKTEKKVNHYLMDMKLSLPLGIVSAYIEHYCNLIGWTQSEWTNRLYAKTSLSVSEKFLTNILYTAYLDNSSKFFASTIADLSNYSKHK